MNAHSAWDIDEKVEELLASPAGCAFLAVLQKSGQDSGQMSGQESGLIASDAVHTETSLQAAYRAINQLNIWQLSIWQLSIWSPDFQETVKYAPLNGRTLRKLARAILELP